MLGMTRLRSHMRHQLVSRMSAAAILLLDLVRVLSGNASEEDLIAVKESEENV